MILLERQEGKMKAIRVHEHGGPEAMQIEEMSVPRPGAGEALVKLAASGVNFIDIYQRTGRYPAPTPYTPGSEGAGVVEAVGAGAAEVAVGDRCGRLGQPPRSSHVLASHALIHSKICSKGTPRGAPSCQTCCSQPWRFLLRLL